MKVQRLRLRYAVTDACQLNHRELLADWERAAREAGIAVAYSEGKRPAPQISVGALLPQGVTSDDEVMDIFLSERINPPVAFDALRERVPLGISLQSVDEIGASSASLQSQIRWAEYRVEVPTGETSAEYLQQAIDELLESDTWPAEYRREKKVREYDLRPLVIDVRLEGERDGCFVLRLALVAEQGRSARADQVVLALGLPEARRIHRLALHLERVPASVLAYRSSDGIES